MATASDRRTMTGRALGLDERVSPAGALKLYLGAADAPAGPLRRLDVGAPADLCLLATPLADALRAPTAQLVRATFIDGMRV
jgi:hypothetical protein